MIKKVHESVEIFLSAERVAECSQHQHVQKNLTKCEKVKFGKNTDQKMFIVRLRKIECESLLFYYQWNLSQRAHTSLLVNNWQSRSQNPNTIFFETRRWNKKDCPSRAFCGLPSRFLIQVHSPQSVHEFVSQRAIAAWCGCVVCRSRYTLSRVFDCQILKTFLD